MGTLFLGYRKHFPRHGGKTAYENERGYCLIEIGRRQKGKTRPFNLQRGRLMPILKGRAASAGNTRRPVGHVPRD